MSSIDDLYNKVAKDYGRKSYRTSDEDSFGEFMKKKTVFMYDQHWKQAWSEFEKPYLQDDYDEMEQFLWNPPGFTPFIFDPPGGWDFPTIPTDPTDPGEPFGWPSLTVFWCSVSGCFCENDTRDATVNCSHEITGITMDFERLAARDFSISTQLAGNSATLTITAGDDPPGSLEVTVHMKAGDVLGEHGSIMITSCSDCEDCETAEELAWDTENTAETCEQGDRVLIAVTGGAPPYRWTLPNDQEGRLSLYHVETMSPVNTVRVGATACGTINVDVVDACDNETSGGLMISDAGEWFLCCQWFTSLGGTCKCYCAPCQLEVGHAVGTGMRVTVACGYVGCGDEENPCYGGSSRECIVDPCTCEDSWGQQFVFPCYEVWCGGTWKTASWEYFRYQFWKC